MAVNTIGSGGDFADLTTYESALQGIHAATETARLISDITDNVPFAGWTTCALTIQGDLTGFTKRKLSSAASGMRTLRINDVDITITIEDLEIDSSAQTSSTALHINLYAGTAILRRVKVYGGPSHNIQIDSGTASIENVLSFNAASRGLDLGASVTANIRNMGMFENGTNGVRWLISTTTVNCFNVWSMNNGGTDFRDDNAGAGEATARLEECVDSDGSGATVEAQKTIVGGASNKTDFTDYFVDPDNVTIPSRDFRLLNTALTLWGISGNPTETPADDFSSLTRAGKDIGPHDFVPEGMAFTRILRSPLRAQSRDALLIPVS